MCCVCFFFFLLSFTEPLPATLINGDNRQGQGVINVTPPPSPRPPLSNPADNEQSVQGAAYTPRLRQFGVPSQVTKVHRNAGLLRKVTSGSLLTARMSPSFVISQISAWKQQQQQQHPRKP